MSTSWRCCRRIQWITKASKSVKTDFLLNSCCNIALPKATSQAWLNIRLIYSAVIEVCLGCRNLGSTWLNWTKKHGWITLFLDEVKVKIYLFLCAALFSRHLFSLRRLQTTVNSPAVSIVSPRCSTLRLCWFRDHHLSVLPWKWLNRAVWLAINNNLRPFYPLCVLFFWTLCVRGGYRPGPEEGGGARQRKHSI